MSAGGYRIESNNSSKVVKAVPIEAKARQMTPLEYMLMVINDPQIPGDRRDRMAIAAAPFLHARIAYEVRTKKAKQTEAARDAGKFGPWMYDLPDKDKAEIRAS